MTKHIRFRETIQIVRDGPHQRYLHNKREREEKRQRNRNALLWAGAIGAALTIAVGVLTALRATIAVLSG